MSVERKLKQGEASGAASEYRLVGHETRRRLLTVDRVAADEIVVSVGCLSVRFTAAEALAIAADLATAASGGTIGPAVASLVVTPEPPEQPT